MSDFGKTKSKAEHRRIREMLSVYIDGELPSGDRARVKEHLAECADCAWEVETLRQTVNLVGQLPKVPVPRAFTIYKAPRPRWISLFRARPLVFWPRDKRWVYTYLKGATALAAALLILVLAGDALIQFQRATTGFAPAMAPAKELAAPTVVAMQEASPVPSPPEEVLDEAEVTPLLPPVEETKAFAPMPTPTVSADKGGGPTTHASATATPLATPAPLMGRAGATGTPPPTALVLSQVEGVEAPAEEAPQAPPAPAVGPTATPQPQMTATSMPAAPLAPASTAPSATPTLLATPTATATATSVPTATPLSVARAPAEVRPTEKRDTLAEPAARPQQPHVTLLRVIEASLCLLVMVLIAATLIVRRRSEP